MRKVFSNCRNVGSSHVCRFGLNGRLGFLDQRPKRIECLLPLGIANEDNFSRIMVHHYSHVFVALPGRNLVDGNALKIHQIWFRRAFPKVLFLNALDDIPGNPEMMSDIQDRGKAEQLKRIPLETFGVKNPRINKAQGGLANGPTPLALNALNWELKKNGSATNRQRPKHPGGASAADHHWRSATGATKMFRLLFDLKDHPALNKSCRNIVLANDAPCVVENTRGHGFLQVGLGRVSLQWRSMSTFSSFGEKYSRIG